MKKGLLPLILFALFVGGLSIAILRGNADRLSSNLIDKPFPEFELSDLNDPDKTLTKKDFAGQVTILNVFGSWCVACLVEHPKLMEVGKTSTAQLVGLNWNDSPREKALNWLSRHGDPFDRVIFDPFGELVIALGVTGAPETFIIDKSGRIVHKHVGEITDEVWDEKLNPIINRLEDE